MYGRSAPKSWNHFNSGIVLKASPMLAQAGLNHTANCLDRNHTCLFMHLHLLGPEEAVWTKGCQGDKLKHLSRDPANVSSRPGCNMFLWKLGKERQCHITKQLVHSFLVNIRISQPWKVMFTSASPHEHHYSRVDKSLSQKNAPIA